MLFVLIGDNCSTNKATAPTADVPLVGRAIHRFNPAVVKDIVKDYASLTTCVYRLMKKLKRHHPAFQAENRTVLEVRDLFDEVIKTYPQTKNRLCENASILHDNVFESAVQKIMKDSEEEEGGGAHS